MKPSTAYPNGVKPQIGDIATSKSIGRGTRDVRVWEACPECGKERWIKRNTSGVSCKSCALRNHSFGEQNRRWNPTRRTITKSGIRITITQDHPYFCMAHHCGYTGYAVLEHRLVMAVHLGRPLKIGEVVHHKDGNNLNNNIDNLLLLSSQAHHSAYTMLQTQINRLEKELAQLQTRVTLVEAENTLLKSQVSMKGIDNPELAEEHNSSLGKRRDSTPPILQLTQDKEKVHSLGKSGGESA